MKASYFYLTVVCIVAIFQLPKLYRTWAEHDTKLKEIELKSVSAADEKLRKKMISELVSEILVSPEYTELKQREK